MFMRKTGINCDWKNVLVMQLKRRAGRKTQGVHHTSLLADCPYLGYRVQGLGIKLNCGLGIRFGECKLGFSCHGLLCSGLVRWQLLFN